MVQFTLTPRQLSVVYKDFKSVEEPGQYEVPVGGNQPGFSGYADAATTQVLTGRSEVRR
jgi:beta-glucosidase